MKTGSNHDLLWVALAATAAAGCGLLAFFLDAAANEALWPSIGVATSLTALAFLFAIRRLGFGWTSSPVVYLSYLWLFHFPLALFTSLDHDMLLSLPILIQVRIFGRSWCRAELIALLCAAAFTIGVAASAGQRSNRPLRLQRWRGNAPLAALGWIGVLAGALIIVFGMVRGGGSQVFLTPYGDLFDSLFSGPFAYGVMLFNLGVPMAITGAKPGGTWALLCLQALCTGVMLLLGARSAALFGPLLVLMVLTKRGMKIPRWLGVTSLVAVFWVIAIVGVARQGAVKDNVLATAGPLDALLEMGGSLYTVRLFDGWILDGDSFQLGGGYWLPFERAIGLAIPGVRSDLNTDPRAASEVIASRTDGLGGSAVAEAYYNFGLFSPFLFFLPLGWLLGYLDRVALSPLSTAWLVVATYPLLMEVRGWFLSVPAMIAIGAAPLVLCSFSLWRLKLRNHLPVTEAGVRPSGPSSAEAPVAFPRENRGSR